MLSGRGIDRIAGDFAPGMVAAEQAVRDSGAEWTVIRANNFNQNFDEDLWHLPLRAGRLALPIGPTPEPFIDAQDVAEAAGRSIQYVELTPEEYRTELLAEGHSEDTATALNSMFTAMRAGHLAEPTDAVRRVLGRDPIGFAAYAARAAAAGAWS